MRGIWYFTCSPDFLQKLKCMWDVTNSLLNISPTSLPFSMLNRRYAIFSRVLISCLFSVFFFFLFGCLLPFFYCFNQSIAIWNRIGDRENHIYIDLHAYFFCNFFFSSSCYTIYFQNLPYYKTNCCRSDAWKPDLYSLMAYLIFLQNRKCSFSAK